MSFDPKTLSMAVGYGNLLFALLVTMYIRQSAVPQPPLQMWRWAKLVVGCGLLLNVAGTFFPHMSVATAVSCILLLGGTLEIAAYCVLFERSGWQRLLSVYALLSMAAVSVIAWSSESHHARIVTFMFAGAVPYLAIPFIVLRKTERSGLTVVIALFDLVLALAMLTRGTYGLLVDELVRLGSHWTATAVYLATYSGLLINGFGFLLLAKHRNDRALAATLKRLQESEETQRQLLSMASHEFRTPAAIIKSSLDSLRLVSDGVSPEVSRRHEQIRNASVRMIDLANALITQERLVNQSFSAHLEPCDLGSVIRDVQGSYDESQPVRALLPSTGVVVPADAALLRIAVHNLIDNAFRHGAAAEAPEVELVDADGHVEIHVRDHGAGVPDALKERIFERHYSSRGELAHGVGLAIVRMIAEAHGGDVRVLDHPPQGADFVIRLRRPRR